MDVEDGDEEMATSSVDENHNGTTLDTFYYLALSDFLPPWGHFLCIFFNTDGLVNRKCRDISPISILSYRICCLNVVFSVGLYCMDDK